MKLYKDIMPEDPRALMRTNIVGCEPRLIRCRLATDTARTFCFLDCVEIFLELLDRSFSK